MKKILVASLVFILLFGCAPEQSESSDTASVNQTEIQLVCQDDKEKLEKIAKAFQKKNSLFFSPENIFVCKECARGSTVDTADFNGKS